MRVRHKEFRDIIVEVMEPCDSDEVYVPENRLVYPQPLRKQDWEPMPGSFGGPWGS